VSDLAPLSVLAAVLPSHVRLIAVADDAMDPTACLGDAVLAAPADGFSGDGLYLVDAGYPRLYRVVSQPATDALRMVSDNRSYPSSEWSREEFTGLVVGKVGAIVRVINAAVMAG
jgi:hypothetical protein